MQALLYQYLSSTEQFVVSDSTQVSQPTTMTFKARLTYSQQQKVNMVRVRYNQLKCKPIQFKVTKMAAPYEAPAKLKVVIFYGHQYMHQ